MQEEKYKAIFEGANDAILIIDIESEKILEMNQKARELGAFEKDGVPQLLSISLGNGDQFYRETDILQWIREAASDGPQRVEWFARNRDGYPLCLEMSLRKVTIAGKDRLVAVVRDITERERSETKYRQLFESASDALFLIDSDTGQILEANSCALSLYGYSHEEVLAKKNMDLSSDPEGTRKDLSGERSVAPFCFHRKKDGTIFPVEVTTRQFNWDNRNVHIASIRDISERRKTEEEKENLQLRLNQTQKMEAIGTLARGIAYNFNNILAAIVGYSEISMIEDDEESRKKDIEEVLKACDRAINLVNQILTVNCQKEQERKPVEVSIIVKEALGLLWSSLPEAITLRTKIKSRKNKVFGNAKQIHQILMNLCANAVHAMDTKGGVLEVQLSNIRITSKGNAPHRDLPPGSYVELTVRNAGYGIDATIMDRIFDPFFTTKALGEGTGSGLSAVYDIVRSYGGAITFQSDPAKGATFGVYFPRINERRKVRKTTKMPRTMSRKKRQPLSC